MCLAGGNATKVDLDNGLRGGSTFLSGRIGVIDLMECLAIDVVSLTY